MGEVLLEFLLSHTGNKTIQSKKNGPAACRSLVDGKQIFHVVLLQPIQKRG
jgi:hypothetical protein